MWFERTDVFLIELDTIWLTVGHIHPAERISIGKSNGLFHRLRAPALLPTRYHPQVRQRQRLGRRMAAAWRCCGQARPRRMQTSEGPILNALGHAERRRERRVQTRASVQDAAKARDVAHG